MEGDSEEFRGKRPGSRGYAATGSWGTRRKAVTVARFWRALTRREGERPGPEAAGAAVADHPPADFGPGDPGSADFGPGDPGWADAGLPDPGLADSGPDDAELSGPGRAALGC